MNAGVLIVGVVLAVIGFMVIFRPRLASRNQGKQYIARMQATKPSITELLAERETHNSNARAAAFHAGLNEYQDYDGQNRSL